MMTTKQGTKASLTARSIEIVESGAKTTDEWFEAVNHLKAIAKRGIKKCEHCRHNKAEYNERYYIKYPWMKTMASINKRLKIIDTLKSPYNPAYKGIKNLLTPGTLKVLWFRDKAYEMKKPSIDRIDSKQHYTFENCRYIEHYENAIASNPPKKVKQLTLDGKLVKIWNSTQEVTREMGISNGTLYNILHKKVYGNQRRLTAKGFKWEY